MVLFLNVEWATWRIGINTAQNPSGEAGSEIQLRNKEILGDLKRRNEAGEMLCQTFALQLGATQGKKCGSVVAAIYGIDIGCHYF